MTTIHDAIQRLQLGESFPSIVIQILLQKILLQQGNDMLLLTQQRHLFDQFFHPSTNAAATASSSSSSSESNCFSMECLQLLVDILKDPNFIREKYDQHSKKWNLSEIEIVRIEMLRQLRLFFFNNDGLKLIFKEAFDDSQKFMILETKAQNLAVILGSLPDIIASIFITRSLNIEDDKFSRDEFYDFIAKETVFSILNSDQNKNYLPEFIIILKIIRLGFSDNIVDAWLHFTNYSDEETLMIDRHIYFWNTILQKLQTISWLENILACLLVRLALIKSYSKSRKLWLLQNIILKVDFTSPTFLLTKNVLCQRLLLVHMLPPESLILLLDFLSFKLSPQDFLQLSHHISQVWGDKSFVHGTDEKLHIYVTAVIRGCIQRILKDDIEESGLLLHLINGVSQHLESSVPSIRRLGMRVGEEFSLIIDTENPLHFDELHDETFNIDDPFESLLKKDSIEPIEDDLSQEQSEDVTSEIKKDNEQNIPRPDEIFNLLESFDPSKIQSDPWYDYPSDDEVDEIEKNQQEMDDEDLLPYADDTTNSSIPSTNFSKKYATPMYLGQCIPLLNSDVYEQYILALEAIEPLIRSKPNDLPRLAPQLADVFLSLQNKFAAPLFASKRMGGLVALLVCSPLQTLPILFQRLHIKNSGLGIRMDILDALVTAARELSKGEKVTLSASGLFLENGSISKSITLDIKGTVVRKSANLSRYENKKNEDSYTRNAFLDVASKFFFPIFHRDVPSSVPSRVTWEDKYQNLSDSKKETSNKFKFKIDHNAGYTEITESDPILLSRFILTAGAILECAKNSPEIVSMARTLLNLVQWTRYRSEPEIRRATMYAFAVVLISIPPTVLISDESGGFLEDVFDAYTWLNQVLQSDSDNLCRTEAENLLRLPLFVQITTNMTSTSFSNTTTNKRIE